MTDEQRAKAERLRDAAGIRNVTCVKGYIEEIPLEARQFDAVISNGVINLSADKPALFREVARVLKPGGRLALADIVTERQLPTGARSRPRASSCAASRTTRTTSSFRPMPRARRRSTA